MTKDAEIVVGFCVVNRDLKLFVAEVNGVSKDEALSLKKSFDNILTKMLPLTVSAEFIAVSPEQDLVGFKITWVPLLKKVLDNLSVMFPYFVFTLRHFKVVDGVFHPNN